MQPGVYDEISNEQYHSGPGISKSGLDLINRSPLHYQAALQADPSDREPTPSQELGTAAHAIILEPHKFVSDYTLPLRQGDVPHAISERDQLLAMVAELNATRLPKLSATGTKDELVRRIWEATPHGSQAAADECKANLEAMKAADLKATIETMNAKRQGLISTTGSMAELAEILRANGRNVTLWAEEKVRWLQNNGHRKVLEPETWQQLHAMRAAVMSHPAACALLTGCPGRAETSIYWNDQATGELCRIRPDFMRDDGVLVDLKTTTDASPDEFARSIMNWRYHVQAAFYSDGYQAAFGRPPKAFAFIAVETKAPHAVAVYVLDEPSLMLGRAEYQQNLADYAQCKQAGTWPGYGDKIQPIALPHFYMNRNAHLLASV